MPRQKTRLKFGKTEFKNAVRTINEGLDIIDIAVKDALEIVDIILSALQRTRNFPLVDDLYEMVAYVSTYIAKIQNQSSEIRKSITLIVRITEEHLTELENNGTEVDS